MLALTVHDWQVFALAIITTVGVFVCAAASISTGRVRWALASGWAFLLTSGYWANVLDAAGDATTLVTVRSVGIGWLAFGFIVLPILAWRDSHRIRTRAHHALKIIEAGASEDQL